MASKIREVTLSRTQRARLRLLAPPEERAGIVNDLEEEAAQIVARDGRPAAMRFVRWQIAHSTLPWIRRRTREAVTQTRRSITMAYRGLWSDARLAVRRLAHSRGFTTLAVATLAIGIGAVSTAFSLAHALWLKPLPYQDPDRLAWIQARFDPAGTTGSLTATELAEYRRPTASLSAVAGFSYGAAIGKVNGEPVRIVADRVSPNLFRVLGVRPAIGRDLADTEADAHVVMLSDTMWSTRFQRDPAIAGKTMTLYGAPYEIAGVMPRGFTFPRGLEAEVWLPATFSDRPDNMGRLYQAVGRLTPGHSAIDATAEIGARAHALALTFPKTNKDWSAIVTPAGATTSRANQIAFEALLGIVGLFLLIACTNLAGLLLARNASRRTEFAVCLSIGASRWRLARMLLVESVVLAGLGCLVGVGLSMYGSRVLASFMPPKTPGLDNVGVNVEVVVVAVLVSMVAAILVGILPAMSLRSLKPSEAIAGGRTVARGTARAQRALIVVEVALAVILLVGAGAMVRSFLGLIGRDRGYEPRGLLTLNVSLPFSDDSYLDNIKRSRAFDDIIARVAAVPGVASAAATTGFPGSQLGILGVTPIANEGRPTIIAAVHSASVDYFRAMGIRIVSGRPFAVADATKAPAVVIVNEMVAREFPDGNPIGKRLPITIFGESQTAEIVGVVANIKLGDRATPRVFVPLAQASPYWIDLVFRSEAGPAAMPAVRRALRDISPELLIENESSFQQIISNSVALERAESACAGMIAVLSAIVAGIGIYALMTFAAAQRRRELGIRVALGSQPGRLFREALTSALRLVGAGVVLGLLATFGLVRALGSQVFGLTSADAVTQIGAAALVLVVSTIAVWFPARRMMRTDPLVALRGD